MNITTTDRFTGCILGGAIGDALGGSIEFDSLAAIRHRCGPAGLRDYTPSEFIPLGSITDDTQMTLFTAEGLIQASETGEDVVAMVHLAYLRWLATQKQRSAHPSFDPHPKQGLAALPQMNQRRAPGGTCLGALEAPVAYTMDSNPNDSKGCGGVMRIAPVGLCFAEPFGTACKIAALTHGHPAGYLAAGALAAIVAQILAGAEVLAAAQVAAEQLASWPHHYGTLKALQAALALAEKRDPSPEKVEQLGAGWIAEEALAIGLYCALVAEDFEHGVLLAVNHSGDSDSTGSITGNILGALWGKQVLPERWLAGLELRQEIEELAVQLHSRYAAPM